MSLSVGALAQDITGSWQGTLAFGKGLRQVVKISKADSGALKVTMYSIDQGSQGMDATSATLSGSALKLDILPLGAVYTGKLAADGNTIEGIFTQGGQSLALNLVRTTAETAWAIPEKPAAQPPMAADADPGFEVATIKPGRPGATGKGFGINGGRMRMGNFSVMDMVEFGYLIQASQVSGLPGWCETDKFDVEGEPDKAGKPSIPQMREMVQKLLADRFALKFHKEKKELPVFALTVAKGGPKLGGAALSKSTSDAPGLQGIGFRPGATGGLVFMGKNATLADLAGALQEVALNRPVSDQTGVTERFDFAITFTPDETQMPGIKLPAAAENAELPSPLFKAMPEQTGLKLDATKAPVDVYVVEHVEKPSAN
jgi:uncharacterized protein (TIGR03435 family)